MSGKKILITIIVFLAFFGAYFFLITYILPDKTDRGLFGDMFGGLNAFFSGLAFLGVIYAILLQRRELELQREELKLTRTEIKRTAEAQEKSEKALSKQAASLKVTAQLNGKSAILQHHNTLIGITQGTIYNIGAYRHHKEAADKIVDDIEKIIEAKE